MEEPIRLVLIDDDEGVLRALALLLRAMRFEVETFSSPQAGIEYAATAPNVDVVVSDLRMPGLSGEDVLVQLRARRGSLPVIIISGHATTEEVAQLRAHGMSGFVPKPFTPDQLLGAMRGLFASAPLKAKVA